MACALLDLKEAPGLVLIRYDRSRYEAAFREEFSKLPEGVARNAVAGQLLLEPLPVVNDVSFCFGKEHKILFRIALCRVG